MIFLDDFFKFLMDDEIGEIFSYNASSEDHFKNLRGSFLVFF